MRRVVFSTAETLNAIIDYNKLPQVTVKLPPGTINACVVKDGPDGIVRLDIRDADGKHHDHVLGHATVAAALLRYCSAAKIPLPKRGQKSLQVVGDNVALYVEINADTKPIKEAKS
jgi:hypothetical protein